MKSRLILMWLLLGLGSQLQVVASLSITEGLVLMLAPVLFFKSIGDMRRDGVYTFFILSLLVFLGCVLACWANATPFDLALRGYAVTSLIPCSIVVGHWLLRRNPSGFKWFLVGGMMSGVVSTFVFQKSVEVSMLANGADGAAAAEAIMSGPIFWINRLSPLVTLPTKGWYLVTPIWFDLLAVGFMAVFSLLTSISGRAASLSFFAFAMLLLIGGKTRRSMSQLGRKFWLWVFLGVVFVAMAHAGYRVAAVNGLLGEEGRRKYELQSQGSESVGRLLLGGRAESFIGLLACRDKPIVGWGPWAMDTDGYRAEFINRFGTTEDIIELKQRQEWQIKNGFSSFVCLIPCHSQIVEFWCWYGICGLVFWLYVIWVFLRYVRQDAWVVPQWYAWLACSLPGVFWGIFFSPFADRFGLPLLVVASLMARAVRRGRFELPLSMMSEIEMKA